jgi:serine protease Do
MRWSLLPKNHEKSFGHDTEGVPGRRIFMNKSAFRAAVFFAVTLTLLVFWGQNRFAADVSGTPWKPSLAPTGVTTHNALPRAIIQVAKENIPAVVHIEVTEQQEVANPLLSLEDNPLLRRFFDIPEDMPERFERKIKGIGSGMFIDPTGHILTSHHVVGDASKILVSLSDGSQYAAKLVGTDPPSDLAVLKISRNDPFPHVTFGDSDRVEVGQWVVAIGQPEGLEQTVTQGIISAKHRTDIASPTSYQDFLQTDAAINPGNSGGPLLTLEGHVIGINSAILSQTGGFMGIGFAVPSNMAVRVSQQLIDHGRVTRGWLGVSVQDITPDMADSFGLETPMGALVSEVVRGGPAEQAGIDRGDVILAYQGMSISDAGFLRNAVAKTPPGSAAAFTLWRKGREMELTVEIGNLQEAREKIIASVEDRLGVQARQVTRADMQQFGLPSQQGVVVERIEPGSILGDAGLEEGDFILAINGHPATGVEEFASLAMAIPPEQPALFLVLDQRTGQTGLLKVEMP